MMIGVVVIYTDFFLSRESLVNELSFKHDAEGATSLLEMQVRKLRDEQSRLMDMLSGFVSTGKENEELFFKSKNLTLSLIVARSRLLRPQERIQTEFLIQI